MQWDANIRLHHMILGVVPRNWFFLRSRCRRKALWVEHPRTDPTRQMAKVIFATTCLSSTPLFSRRKPVWLSWLKWVCGRHSSVRYVILQLCNECHLGRCTYQAGWKWHFCLQDVLWILSHLNGATSLGQTSLVQNWKRRKERSLRRFLGHLTGCRALCSKHFTHGTTELWVPTGSLPSLGPTAGYFAAPGVHKIIHQVKLGYF